MSATAKVIAATDANSGDMVFLTSCDAWTPDVRIAELLTDPADFDWRLAFARRLTGVTDKRDADLVNALEDEHGLPALAA